MEERVQKIMAQAGYGSRRSCEELIGAGRVKVNGKIAILGTKADAEKDLIQVDNQAIPKSHQKRYIALHKPRGVLSDVDPNDPRPTVLDIVPAFGHLFAVGRLDYDSEGLILLTNDGELANRLTHPRYGHEKEYRVLTANRPDEEQLSIWRRGVVLEDGYRTAPAQVIVDASAAKGTWLRVVLNEGRKRQIREVGSRIGLPVHRIVRVRIGTLLLGDMKPGEWRNLTSAEVRSLKELQGQAKRPRRLTSSSYPHRKVFAKPRSPIPQTESRPGDRDVDRSLEKRPGRRYDAKKSGEVSDTRTPRRGQQVVAGQAERRAPSGRRMRNRFPDAEIKPEGQAGDHEERTNSRFQKKVFNHSGPTGSVAPRPVGRYKNRPGLDHDQHITPKPARSRSSKPKDFNRSGLTGPDAPRPASRYKNRPAFERDQQNDTKPAHSGSSRPNEFHPGSTNQHGTKPIRRRRP